MPAGGSIDVFFYGLFMDVNLLLEKGLTPTNVKMARLDGFDLRIGERATLIKSDGRIAYGVVCTMPVREVELLYSDPSVADYRACRVTAIFDDSGTSEAVCYNLKDQPRSDTANRDYAAKLWSLGRLLGLPDDYLAEIRRVADGHR